MEYYHANNGHVVLLILNLNFNRLIKNPTHNLNITATQKITNETYIENVYDMRVTRQDSPTSQSGNSLFSTYFKLTVKMSNLTDKRCFKPINSDKTIHLNASKRLEGFSEKSTGLESSFLMNKTNQNTFTDMLPRQSTVNCQMNQLFKVPNFERLPVKKATVKSIKSPRRVQTGRVKNDLKSSQQSKMSLIPRPSFINSRKSLHGYRSNQLNARKELIKKMVFLAECTLKENKEVKQSTPVKMLAGLTPKKTPRSGGYFILPEFKKKVPKLEDIRSPLQDLIKKEMFAYSTKPTPLVNKINEISPVKPIEADTSDFIVKPKENNSPDRNKRFTTILCHCKMYSTEVNLIHEKLKALDNAFETKLKNLPDYRVYNEFCFYQSKKEELYKQIQILEADLRNVISRNTNAGSKLEAYVKKRQEFFEKQINLHKDFEQVVASALGKNEDKTVEENLKNEEDAKPKVETPKLRRSLRLSKIKKSKFEERTPMTKKLKKLDSKSKGIQKTGKVRSP